MRFIYHSTRFTDVNIMEVYLQQMTFNFVFSNQLFSAFVARVKSHIVFLHRHLQFDIVYVSHVLQELDFIKGSEGTLHA